MRSVFPHTIIEEEEEGAEGSQRWFGRTKGSAIPPWIPSVLLFSMWIVDVYTCLGERSRKSLQLVMLETSPTLILVPVLENKSGNKRDTAGIEYRGVKTLLNQRLFLFGALNFYFILFCIFILCYYIFFSYGKLNDG
jgi:hypothetical protein